MPRTAATSATASDYSTIEVAKLLGLAVRSIQLMVDRGDLEAWRTPGGHRRISKESVQRWAEKRGGAGALALATEEASDAAAPASTAPSGTKPSNRLLLIEDSIHYQKLIKMVLAQKFPQLEVHTASDGIVGLAMYGKLQPGLLLVDILLPGIDGATLISSLRSDPHFAGSHLIVITSLDESQRQDYAAALEGVPVVHKPRLVMDLPPLLSQQLELKGAP